MSWNVKFLGKWSMDLCSGCRAMKQHCAVFQFGASRDPHARTISLCVNCTAQLAREVELMREVEAAEPMTAAASGPATAPVKGSP